MYESTSHSDLGAYSETNRDKSLEELCKDSIKLRQEIRGCRRGKILDTTNHRKYQWVRVEDCFEVSQEVIEL